MTQQTIEALLRLPDVLARTGLSRSTLYRLVQEGKFSSPIELLGRTRAWVASDVDAWVLARIRAARGSGATNE